MQLRGRHRGRVPSWDGARAVAYRSREHIPHDLGTAVNVQAMVFGNRDDHSGTGVGFTRDPATGEPGPYGDFLVNAQGEDVVAGIRNTLPLAALRGHVPGGRTPSCSTIFDRLERHYRDMLDTEFTIEQGKLWMLQTRVGKRTGRGRAAHRGRHDRRPDIRLTAGGGGAAGRPPSTSTRCCTPQLEPATGAGARHRPRRLAGRRRRAGVLHRRRRASTPRTGRAR